MEHRRSTGLDAVTLTTTDHSFRSLRPLSVLTRVFVAIGLLVFAFGAALADSVAVHRQMVDRVERLNDRVLPTARDLGELRQLVVTMVQLATPSREPENPEIIARALLNALPVAATVDDQLRSVAGRVAGLQQTERPDISPLWTNVSRTLEELAAEHREHRTELRDLVLAFERDELPPLNEYRRLLSELGEFEKRIGDLARVVDTLAANQSDGIVAAQQAGLFRSSALSVVALLVALTMALLVRRALMPIGELSTAAIRLREGMPMDQLAASTRDDEIGQLARQFDTMAQAVRERDQQLRDKNQALEHALKALMEAQQGRVQAERMAAVGELTSRITHELRNPLSSIGLNIEMLTEELAEQPALHDAAQMVRTMDLSVQRLIRLTDEFLQMARGVANFGVVDLTAVVEECVRVLDAECRRQSVAVEVDCEDAFAFGDRDQLLQVLINLVQNALQAISTTASAGTIRLVLDEVDRDAVLIVEDSGPGIVMEPAEKVLEAFVTGRAGGTGLGLSICRDIVAAHRGQLLVQAHGSLGGARFEVRLPSADTEG
jgi:signal transduction histidine kinase